MASGEFCDFPSLLKHRLYALGPVRLVMAKALRCQLKQGRSSVKVDPGKLRRARVKIALEQGGSQSVGLPTLKVASQNLSVEMSDKETEIAHRTGANGSIEIDEPDVAAFQQHLARVKITVDRAARGRFVH
jgi:hypothetical protein